MLQNIHIQNFRCFEDFKAEGFERINLIGGKNNSGKTCLLEAILSFEHGFFEVSRLRNEEWSDIINVNFKQKGVRISSLYGQTSYYLEMTNVGSVSITQKIPESIQYVKVQKKYPDFDIAQKFDFINRKKLENDLLNAISYIDNKIDGLRTFGETGLKLFISTKGEEWKPITSYGDAVAHLVNYFSFLLAKKAKYDNISSILLIDEIENGIHYTAHYDFWKNIFLLSKELNVQVFATTHSLEMIKAFNSIAKDEGEGAYFEMSREFETGQIFVQKHDTALLEYELTKEDSTLRGE
jgi:AAA15 family ATPase/GTPase